MLDELVNAKLVERDQLWTMATKVTQGMDGMPHGTGVSDKVGNIAVKLTALADDLDRIVDLYVDHKAAVVAELEKLPPEEYGALHRHYVRYMTWRDVAEDMGYCEVQIWRIKNKAFNRLKHVIECYTIPAV